MKRNTTPTLCISINIELDTPLISMAMEQRVALFQVFLKTLAQNFRSLQTALKSGMPLNLTQITAAQVS